jgi:hypothetical protein
VETERFRAKEQGKPSFEFEMYKGVLIDDTAMVSSFVELTTRFSLVRSLHDLIGEKKAPTTPLKWKRGRESLSTSSHVTTR